MLRVLKYIFYDLLRTRFVVAYTLILFCTSLVLFQLDSDSSKVVLGLLNIVLMAVPLVSIVFTTIHFFNSYEFIELMLAQPVNRRLVFFSEYFAVATSLILACLAGIGIPAIFFQPDSAVVALLVVSVALTLVFVSLAFLASVLTRDKAKAIGLALLFWFYFALIYDGLLLWIVYNFNDYPLEKLTLGLIALNPIDLARIVMLLQLDVSALMGYTGAFYKEVFGTNLGLIFSLLILLLWSLAPLLIAARIFSRKDL
jgi:Cu-processing system permease protein